MARLIEELKPVGAVAAARKELAEELLGDLRRLDTQLAELKERLAAVVTASGTTATKIFGVGAGSGRHHRRPNQGRAPLRQ
ncbi:MAG TPA: hypothetical protein VEJ84_10950 [Acidimicrobiales bacterium]|nr:hypothetical protein [Acidimicrobiales bacterium]